VLKFNNPVWDDIDGVVGEVQVSKFLLNVSQVDGKGQQLASAVIDNRAILAAEKHAVFATICMMKK
jgi:hypothetical protein